MPYNANIPQPTDQISDSQNDLLNNFGSINTFVNVNHVTFDDPNQGKHFFVEMPQQGAASTTQVGEVGIQCLASQFGAGLPTLVYLPENGAAPIEMTSANMAQPGWSFLPSGLLIKWGTIPVIATGPATANFPAGGTIPAYGTAIYNITFQVSCTNAILDPNLFVMYNQSTTTLTTIGYNVVARNAGATNPATIYYISIGT